MAEQNRIENTSACEQLKAMAEQHRWKHIFCVTGKKSFTLSGAEKKLFSQFSSECITLFNDFHTNPTLTDVCRGIDILRSAPADVIVSIGGGSVIDMAKLINGLSSCNDDLTLYVTGEKHITRTSAPHVSIPTTAGSGSEATHFAVVYLQGKKFSVAHQSLLPQYVIHDVTLTDSLSPYITACSGIDALCQAIESYWNIHSNDISSSYAKDAITLVLAHLFQAVHRPGITHRSALQNAAYLAGKAINITKTTAPHAFSYHLTSHYHLPHGHAVALMLGWIYDYTYHAPEIACADKRGMSYVKNRLSEIASLFSITQPHTFKTQFYDYITSLSLDCCVLSMSQKNCRELLDSVDSVRISNHPVRLSITPDKLHKEFHAIADRYDVQ